MKRKFNKVVLAFHAHPDDTEAFAAGTLKIPEGDVIYSKFFPHSYLNTSFMLLVLLVVIFNIWTQPVGFNHRICHNWQG